MSAGEGEQEAERHSATKHVYEVRPRKDHRGVDLISDALPFGRLWNCARIVFDCRMTNDPAMM
jgi:hypothetical protein